MQNGGIGRKETGAEVFVVKDNYPFAEIFRNADLSDEAMTDTYQRIRKFVFSAGAALSPLDLMRKVAPGDLSFLLRFYMLFESGSVSVGQNFALSPQPMRDPADSLLYRRVCALKKRL